jgi:hypothetical protein
MDMSFGPGDLVMTNTDLETHGFHYGPFDVLHWHPIRSNSSATVEKNSVGMIVTPLGQGDDLFGIMLHDRLFAVWVHQLDLIRRCAEVSDGE